MEYIREISKALDKETETIAFLGFFPLRKLDKKLQLVKLEIELAKKYKVSAAVELLEIWQQQLLDAIEVKKEMKLEDNEQLDMDFLLEELEAYELIEKRQELLKKKLLKDPITETKSKTKSSS